MIRTLFSALVLFTSLNTFAAPGPASSIDEAKRFGRLYISGEPSDQALAHFKKEKGAEVLDLRDFNELGSCSQPASASKLGLRYNRVVFAKKAEIHPETIAGIDKVIKEAGQKPILLFCKTGNRAAAYLAIHLVRDEKMPVEQAILTASGMGLKDDMAQAVRKYLEAHPN
ncbi:MAG: hypothetical protein KF799_06850 [Bdellovibrionales bacterium]|nr:hypothetical protein [Bdellovibrionales bacterium]